jgi:hypothetical protein
MDKPEQTIFYLNELGEESKQRAFREIFNKHYATAFEQLAIDLVQNLYMLMFELPVCDIQYEEGYTNTLIDCRVQIDPDRWEVMDVRVQDALQSLYVTLYDEDNLTSIIDKHSIMFKDNGATF